MSLRIRRGTNAQRTGVTFDLGELVWTQDTERLFIGDGITAGGKNVLATSAGVGLVWNPTTQTIDISGSNLSTTNIGEGSNLYYTPERAQDAAASLFTSGTHSNISFFYDDVANKINATVTLDGVGLANVQADTAPTLGGNLTMNGKTITGTGNINITGNIAGTTLSGNLGANLGLNSYNINGIGNINITGSVTATQFNGDVNGDVTGNLNGNVVGGRVYLNQSLDQTGILIDSEAGGTGIIEDLFTIRTYHDDFDPSGAIFSRARGSFASPQPLENEDSIFTLGFYGTTSDGTNGVGAVIGAQVDGTPGPGIMPSQLVFATTSNTGAFALALQLDSSQNAIFSGRILASDGTASNPSISFTTDGSRDTGFFHPGDGVLCASTDGTERVRIDNGGMRVAGFMKVADVAGTLPAPAEAGMIVLDGTTFKGYNGTSWVTLG